MQSPVLWEVFYQVRSIPIQIPTLQTRAGTKSSMTSCVPGMIYRYRSPPCKHVPVLRDVEYQERYVSIQIPTLQTRAGIRRRCVPGEVCTKPDPYPGHQHVRESRDPTQIYPTHRGEHGPARTDHEPYTPGVSCIYLPPTYLDHGSYTLGIYLSCPQISM